MLVRQQLLAIAGMVGRSPVAVRMASSSALKGMAVRPILGGMYVRYAYEGSTLKRDGRLLELEESVVAEVRGDHVLAALEADGADLKHFMPRAYDPHLGGWAPLLDDTQFAADDDASPARCINVQLFRRALAAVPPLEDDSAATDGFFTVGVVGAKNSFNLGTLWRSAYQLGSASVFVVNDRGASAALHKESSDTTKAWRRIPLVRHPDFNAFSAAQPFGALWVAVEMGGEPLEEFEHPERAVYLLGSEDSGLPESVLKACHRRVTLPCAKYESFNVAVAGSMVLYDRLAKQKAKQKAQQKAADGDATIATPTDR